MNFGLRSVTSIFQGAASTIKRYIRNESGSGVKAESEDSDESNSESESDAKRIKLDLVQDTVNNCVQSVETDDEGAETTEDEEASVLFKDTVEDLTEVIKQSCEHDEDGICDKEKDPKCDEVKISTCGDDEGSTCDDVEDSIDTEKGGSMFDNDVENMATEIGVDCQESPDAAGPNEHDLSDCEETDNSTSEESSDGIYDANSDSLRCTLNKTCEILNEVGLTLTEDLEGRELDAVWTVCQHSSGLVWLVKFKDNDPLEMVPGKLMNQYFPLTVIRFYERRLNIPPTKKSQKEKKRLSPI